MTQQAVNDTAGCLAAGSGLTAGSAAQILPGAAQLLLLLLTLDDSFALLLPLPGQAHGCAALINVQHSQHQSARHMFD